MALSVKRWIAAALMGCAVVAVGLLPPEVEPPPDLLRFTPRQQTATAQIARAVQRDYQTLLQLAHRDEALRLLRATRAAGTAPVTLIDPRVPEHPGIGRVAAARTIAAFDSTMRALAPRDTGIQLVLFASRDTEFAAPRVGGLVALRNVEYALPGVTDGRTCLVIVPVSPRFYSYTSDLLGPCGFYAAFGRPGPAVRQWLRATGYYVATNSDWSTARSPHRVNLDEMMRNMSLSQIWDVMGYAGLTHDAAACAAGRLWRCRIPLDAIPPWAGPHPGTGPLADITTGSWWHEEQQWFLADLVQAMGYERFGRFWRSPLPRDSAFAAAFGTSIEQWTHRWIAERRPGVRLGSAIRLSSALLGFVFAIGLVAGGAYYTTRRRIA